MVVVYRIKISGFQKGFCPKEWRQAGLKGGVKIEIKSGHSNSMDKKEKNVLKG